MKKIILPLFAWFFLATNANAQASIGPEVGLNVSNIAAKDGTQTGTFAAKVGFKAGGIADITLSDNFYLQPGIFFSQKGAKINHDPLVSFSYIFDINYIQIPVNILYKFGQPSGTRFFLGLGLAFANCVGGHFAYGNITQKINIGDNPNNDQVRSLDASYNTQFGCQIYSGFIFRLQTETGLANIKPGGKADYYFHNETLTLSLAYLINSQSHQDDRRKRPGGRTKRYYR
jgi:hypothetical protein